MKLTPQLQALFRWRAILQQWINEGPTARDEAITVHKDHLRDIVQEMDAAKQSMVTTTTANNLSSSWQQTALDICGGSAALDNPDFNTSYRVHDWRNYVPRELKDDWLNLTFEAKMVAFLIANRQADNEDWE